MFKCSKGKGQEMFNDSKVDKKGGRGPWVVLSGPGGDEKRGSITSVEFQNNVVGSGEVGVKAKFLDK